MAHWFLTTSETKARHQRSLFSRMGLSSDASLEAAATHLWGTVYRKRRIPDAMSYTPSEGSWIWVSGTVLCDDRIGTEALPAVLNRFLEGGITSARRHSFGHYAIAIRHDHSITIFSDEYAAIPVFYSHSDGFTASTSLRHIAAGPPQAAVSGALNIVLEAVCGNALAGETMYAGVKRLAGDEALTFDIATSLADIHAITGYFSPDPAMLDPQTGALNSAYFERVKTTFRTISRHPSIYLYSTGGRDSRTVLAGLLTAGRKPDALLSMAGTTGMDDASETDTAITAHLAAHLAIPSIPVNFSSLMPHSPDEIRAKVDRYGFNLIGMNANDGVAHEQEFGLEPYPALQLAGFSPAFSHVRYHDLGNLTRTLSDVVDQYPLLDPRHHGTADSTHTLSHRIRAHVGRVVPSSKTDLTLAEYARAMRLLTLDADARNIHFMNDFGYFLAPFHTARLGNPLLHLGTAHRVNDRLQITLVNQLWPDLLGFPFYSGARWYRLDRRTLTLRRWHRRSPASVLNSAVRKTRAAMAPYLWPRKNAVSSGPRDTRLGTRARARIESSIQKHRLVDGMLNMECPRFAYMTRLYQVLALLMATDYVADDADGGPQQSDGLRPKAG